MPEIADTANKILPPNVISAPAHTFEIECTREELKNLVLDRLNSILKRHGANYFTVDDFNDCLWKLFCGSSPKAVLDFPDFLLKELEREGRIAIVDFSPADIYRIVDEPSPSSQTRS